MDTSRADQICADVEDCTRKILDRAFDKVSPEGVEEIRCLADWATRAGVVTSIVKHHESLLPFSDTGDEQNTIRFQGTEFVVRTGSQIWEPDLFEIAFIPPVIEQRIDSQFGVELPLENSERYSIVRIYPPRLDIMFEFQQYTIRDMLQAALNVGDKWVLSRTK